MSLTENPGNPSPGLRLGKAKAGADVYVLHTIAIARHSAPSSQLPATIGSGLGFGRSRCRWLTMPGAPFGVEDAKLDPESLENKVFEKKKDLKKMSCEPWALMSSPQMA